MEDYRITKYGELQEYIKMNQCTWLVVDVATLLVLIYYKNC